MSVVLYCKTIFQDGREESAEIFVDQAADIRSINEHESKKYGCQFVWQLYELGPEIPLACETVEEQKVETKKVQRFKVQQ